MSDQMLYNLADDLLSRNIIAGRGDKIAFIDANGSYSYADVAQRANRAANALRERGIEPEQRVVLCMLDTIDLVAAFLGAIKAGIVPIPINTRLTEKDYAYIVDDSRATGLVVSEPLLPLFESHLRDHASLKVVLVSGASAKHHELFAAAMEVAANAFETASTRRDDMCFWLYTSGTTGMPKGAVHLHSSAVKTADLYAIPTLGIDENDVIYSAAKLFFAYGLGNALSFPMAVGATTVLLDGMPTPEAVADILTRHGVSLFFGVPTLYGMLLASDALPAADEHELRLCVSAGEALPGELLRRWNERMGTDILDGLGSTEMLHIFLTNHQDDINPNSSGKAVSGYELRLVDDDGTPIPDGEVGHLEVSGSTSAIMYWNQRERSRETFKGRWTRTGDKYSRDGDGNYIYGGRSDDMMKVGGIYVSPFEVEGALLEHEAILEAAVVAHPDQDGLIKPKAFVVTSEGYAGTNQLADDLQTFVRRKLADFKYPRWIVFRDELPKTATGKIQRFKLRA
ncbi:MAG: Benzoate--CoA ligase [Alphaproteobacteria bacterium MarineAlpha4_Bin2]|nr:MAG: Benzoate--CoA ligase [Alphaproteobacteria bacterium MarineAlpha4_Bin2]